MEKTSKRSECVRTERDQKDSERGGEKEGGKEGEKKGEVVVHKHQNLFHLSRLIRRCGC